MSPRELIALVEELPDDSRYKRRQGSGFSGLEALLARLINQYTQFNVSDDDLKPDEHFIRAPNDEPDAAEEAPLFDPASYDEINRMLDGDMSVYSEINTAIDV